MKFKVKVIAIHGKKASQSHDATPGLHTRIFRGEPVDTNRLATLARIEEKGPSACLVVHCHAPFQADEVLAWAHNSGHELVSCLNSPID